MSEMILKGFVCRQCGEFLGEASGCPRDCMACLGFDEDLDPYEDQENNPSNSVL